MRARASSLWRSGGRRCCWGWVSIFGEGVTGMDMEMEVKADALEGAFDAVLAAEAVDELKASVAALKTQVDAQAVAASRLPLDRSEERRVGKEGGSTCRSRWSP